MSSVIKVCSLFIIGVAVVACNNVAAKAKVEKQMADTSLVQTNTTTILAAKAPVKVVTVLPLDSLYKLPDTTFVRLADYSKDFAFDMRYATNNNFLNTQVYDCAECYTRAKTAQQLIKANTAFLKQGVRIKFFDCYRPLDVQKKMWKIKPNPIYVANPAKGSIHNKGGAVDITLVNTNGEELPMGTGFDFFGKEAHHTYTNLPANVLENRTLLKSIMENNGFASIESEWWHYNLKALMGAKVANFVWDCDTE